MLNDGVDLDRCFRHLTRSAREETARPRLWVRGSETRARIPIERVEMGLVGKSVASGVV